MTDSNLGWPFAPPETVSADTPEVARERIRALRDRLAETAAVAENGTARLGLLLELARQFLELKAQSDAWDSAREALDLAIAHERWTQAAEACEALYFAAQPSSLAALGQGVWLAVTYPVDPALTVGLLEHIVDATPDRADGAAVAAAAAHYVADLRAPAGQTRDNLLFFTSQLLARVARRHSGVEDEATFDAWMTRLELKDPQQFLMRLRNVVDVLVQDEWWFDRDSLRARLPVN